MKYNSIKYILVILALFGCSHFAFAQKYHSEGGVSTAKEVSERNSDGSYTITLETFAEGSSEAATFAKKDIVLVLDVSGSMDYSKGTPTATNSRVTYDMVASGNATYYRRTTSNNEYVYTKVYAGTFVDNWGTTYYGLYTYAAGPNYFEYDSNKNNVYRNDLYTGVSTRMDELKKAVKEFIDNIELDNRQKPNGKPRGKLLGNRISIIKFAGTKKETVGNDTYPSGGNTYNNTQIVKRFTDVDDAVKVQELKDAVDAFESKGGTQAWDGMSLAVDELKNANANATKIVVFFTDGDPDDKNYSAIGDNLNGSTNAYAAKNDYSALVYSIGLFTSQVATNSNRYRYLNYVSSNYPTAIYRNGNMNQGTGGNAQSGYYKDASGNIDLSSIFKAITDDIGRMGDDVDETSQIKDVVSSSFTLPIDVSEMTEEQKAAWVKDNVEIYTEKVSLTGTSGWQEDDYDLSNVVATIGEDENGHSTLNVTGFDFTKDDSDVGAGDGNWVGTRKVTVDGVTTSNWYGRKLVVKFNIVEADDVTGGDATNTNTKDSGVYIYDENGKLKKINSYDVPHTDLPVNIRIKKDGLRHGESATFEIWRAVPKLDANGKIVYNDIGKPTPDESKWEDWSKVILTNKGADGDFVEKTLLALDPSYVYKIVEDAWGWAYTLSHTGGDLTTATVEVNPFTFTNKEKTNVPKHAEAVTINHFGLTIQGGEFQGKQEEHYKSSKVQSFSK